MFKYIWILLVFLSWLFWTIVTFKKAVDACKEYEPENFWDYLYAIFHCEWFVIWFIIHIFILFSASLVSFMTFFSTPV